MQQRVAQKSRKPVIRRGKMTSEKTRVAMLEAQNAELPSDYKVPSAVLNVAYGNNGDYGSMPCRDSTYRIPDEWLKANAERFHFTDEQIINSAVSEFSAPDLPEMASCYGVYFLIENKEIVYVGQSNDINTRLTQHRENGIVFESFAWFEAPQPYLRAIESYYIHRIQPRLNYDYPRQHDFSTWARQFDKNPPKKREPVVIVVMPTR